MWGYDDVIGGTAIAFRDSAVVNAKQENPENDPENEYFKEVDDNDRSLVTMISCQGKKFLFTGDIEKERIELLLASGVDLSCD